MSGTTALLTTREAILAPQPYVIERVEVPEWGGAVLVRSGTGEERDAWEQAVTVRKRGEGGKLVIEPRRDSVREEAVWRCVCTEDGTLVLSKDDVAALRKRNAAALDRVFAKFCELWGVQEKDVKQLEDEEKN